MSTDEIPPDIGFFFDAMSAPLDKASMLYEKDDRFRAIAVLLETISAEWTRDNARTGIDLDRLGQTLADVQQNHPGDANVNSLVRFYLALTGVRSGPWYAPSPAPPAPTAAPPTPRRLTATPTATLTVFDVAGTSALSVLTGGRAGAPTSQTVPAWGLATLTDPNLITIVEVPYPACVPFNASCQAGVTTLKTLIDQKTTDKFAMVGTSQGAMVVSQVYDTILKTGCHDDDFVQGITYGNPCRKQGSIAPGCVDPGGYGINVDSWLQPEVDGRWWDFVNPGDPAACNGAGPWLVNGFPFDYRDSIGEWAALLFWEMCNNFSGNIGALIAKLNPPLTMLTLVISLVDTLTGAGLGGPHTTYDQTTPISGNSSTCAELAALQLTDIAKSL
jgi:hypothetical protein